MNNDMFKDMREQMKPDHELLERLEEAVASSCDDPSTHSDDAVTPPTDAAKTAIRYRSVNDPDIGGRKSFFSKTLLIPAAAVLVLLCVAVGLFVSGQMPGLPGNDAGKPVAGIDAVLSDNLLSSLDVAQLDDYGPIYEKIAEVQSDYGYTLLGSPMVAEDAASSFDATTGSESAAPTNDTAAPVAPQSEAAKTEAVADIAGAGSGDYSETNVQVQGIDEGDIVKTDGAYIYVLSGTEVVIFKAGGAQTEEVSRIKLVADPEDATSGAATSSKMAGDSIAMTSLYRTPMELYVSGARLFTVVGGYAGYTYLRGPDDEAVTSETVVTCIDIGDPAAPVVETSFAQSGNYNSSRLNGEILYLISSYYVENPVEENPGTYVPLIGQDGSSELMRVDDIAIMPIVDVTSYTVITSIHTASLTRVDEKSVLGQASTVYMSAANLYLASSIYDTEKREPYRDGVYTVTEYLDKQTTQISRIAIADGVLTVSADCTIDGGLLNQFSLDEYEGNLRLVVTKSNYGYKVYRDEEKDIEDYKPNDDIVDTNALYILDPSMQIIGSIEGLAADEWIYSARFAGDVGYMVTYKRIDPLFAMDLSDPTAPKITGELKIPGFSTYLHPYGAGKLFGLGFEATENTTEGIKISMFDVSDPYDVSEITWSGVDADYSPAAYNHKAVLIDVEKNLIGFAGIGYGDATKYDRNRYFVYGYEEGRGFVLKGAPELSGSDSGFYRGSENTRGLYIGDYLYVASDYYLDIFDMNTLEKMQSIQIREVPDYSEVMPLMTESILVE